MQISEPKDNHEVSANSPIRPRPAPQRPRMKGRLSASPRPSRPRPHPARSRTGYRFLDSPEAPPHKASDGLPILRFTRGRLGNDLIASASTDFPDKASRPVNAPNHSCNVSRMMAQYRRVTDGTRDRTEQGLPATVLSTVPMTGGRTTLCYLIPAPGTARRGESSPSHYSLEISV